MILKNLDEKITLAKEGICINYVVPDNDHNIQSKFSGEFILRFFCLIRIKILRINK